MIMTKSVLFTLALSVLLAQQTSGFDEARCVRAKGVSLVVGHIAASTLTAREIAGGLIRTSSSPFYAQEKVTLDPVATPEYRMTNLSLSWAATECQVAVTLTSLGVPPRALTHAYGGMQACQMLQALNKADLSKVSLQRRIIERLIADKVIVGTITGTPE